MMPVALLIHVPDVAQGLKWYKQAFPDAKERLCNDDSLAFLKLNGFMIEIVLADNKVGSGKRGTVLYWQVSDLDKSLAKFEAMGAKLYRGPMKIENGNYMCQVEDPFGNLIGLRGA